MRISRAWIILTFVTAGCTGRAPAFSQLDQNLVPPITFGGSATKALTRVSPTATDLVQGECDPKVRAIQVNVIATGLNGTLDVISVGAPNVSCAGGTFSFTLKSLNALVTTPVAFTSYAIEFRADTAGGLSSPSLLTVTLIKDAFELWHLKAGATESGTGPRIATSSHFRADLVVTSQAPGDDATQNPDLTTAKSTHFTLKRGRAGLN